MMPLTLSMLFAAAFHAIYAMLLLFSFALRCCRHYLMLMLMLLMLLLLRAAICHTYAPRCFAMLLLRRLMPALDAFMPPDS